MKERVLKIIWDFFPCMFQQSFKAIIANRRMKRKRASNLCVEGNNAVDRTTVIFLDPSVSELQHDFFQDSIFPESHPHTARPQSENRPWQCQVEDYFCFSESGRSTYRTLCPLCDRVRLSLPCNASSLLLALLMIWAML